MTMEDLATFKTQRSIGKVVNVSQKRRRARRMQNTQHLWRIAVGSKSENNLNVLLDLRKAKLYYYKTNKKK